MDYDQQLTLVSGVNGNDDLISEIQERFGALDFGNKLCILDDSTNVASVINRIGRSYGVKLTIEAYNLSDIDVDVDDSGSPNTKAVSIVDFDGFMPLADWLMDSFGYLINEETNKAAIYSTRSYIGGVHKIINNVAKTMGFDNKVSKIIGNVKDAEKEFGGKIL